MKETLKQTRLTLELNEQQTLWNFISFGKFSSPFVFISVLRKSNVRYMTYIGFATTVQIMTHLPYFKTVLWTIMFESLSILSFLSLILECNILIFKQSLTSFGVYYKTINISIGIIADTFNCDWYKEYYYRSSNSNDVNVDMNGLYIIGILSTIKFTLAMGFISILDGYMAQKSLKIIIIIVFLSVVFISHFLVGIVFQSYRMNDISYIFNYPLHWGTVNTSCINNATIFVLTQLYQSIRHPSKLIFIPTLIQLEETQRQTKINTISVDTCINTTANTDVDLGGITALSDDNDDKDAYHLISTYTKATSIRKQSNNIVTEIVLPYRLYINHKDRLYYSICVCNSINCINHERIVKCIFSRTLFWCILIHFAVAGSIWFIQDGKLNVYYEIVVLCINVIAAIIWLLSLNSQIFKFHSNKIGYVWKLLDAIIICSCVIVLVYHYNTYAGSSRYTTIESVIISTLTVLDSIMIVVVVSTIQALTVTMNTKWHAIIVSNFLVIDAIVYYMFFAVSYFIHTSRDYTFLNLSLNTLIIEKAIDLSIFFLSQLYDNIKYGSKGIAITGFVNKKWKKIIYKQYHGNVHDHSTTVELVANDNGIDNMKVVESLS